MTYGNFDELTLQFHFLITKVKICVILSSIFYNYDEIH